MSDKYKELLEQIDQDKGLTSKRKLLTIVSLIMLAIQFSGAQIVEANTFILKLSFTHQNGIDLLLAIVIAFLILRYYNYARPYHDELLQLWSSRMLKEPFFYYLEPLDNDDFPSVFEDKGLIIEILEKELSEPYIAYKNRDHQYASWRYSCNGIFSRSISFNLIHDSYGHYVRTIKLNTHSLVNTRSYLKILWLELKYQTKSFITHRENLDIYTPYFLASAAIGSYIFSAELQLLISQVSVLLH
ncbi:hypothetical protein [Methylophaga sp.]|uniref:hypothetical protein n=1 Tax=Methylophaga sp. TaxID=2024840 RepID=UPI003A8D9433